jgi:hypothetical protein
LFVCCFFVFLFVSLFCCLFVVILFSFCFVLFVVVVCFVCLYVCLFLLLLLLLKQSKNILQLNGLLILAAGFLSVFTFVGLGIINKIFKMDDRKLIVFGLFFMMMSNLVGIAYWGERMKFCCFIVYFVLDCFSFCLLLSCLIVVFVLF